MPISPTRAALPSLVAAIHGGGWGSWKGLGVTMRRGKSRYLPWNSKCSDSHMPTMASMASRAWSLEFSRSTWNAVCSIGVDRPVPHSTRPLDRMSAVATFSATRMGGPKPWGTSVTPKPEPDLLGDLGQGADQHLGGRAVRAALPEVVLDVPGGVEAQRVGQADLLERLGVGLAARPAAGRRGGGRATDGGRRSRRAGRASWAGLSDRAPVRGRPGQQRRVGMVL